MFRFIREKILPLFLASQMTTAQLAKKAGVAYQTAQKAVNGLPVSAPAIDRVAKALNIEPLNFLSTPI